MRSRLGPFGHTPFTVYWAGGLISNIGTWLQAVVGSVFVYDRTGSALAVGILNFATFLPILIFSVWGGVLSDRFDRRHVTVVTHVISLVVGTGLAVLTVTGSVTEVHVVVTAFLLQTSWAIAKPSVISLLPALVPRAALAEAVGLNTLQFMVAQLVGPVLATILLGTAGYALAFSINAATFLGPILSMVYLYSRGLGARAQRTTRTAASEPPMGIVAYVRSQPWIASVLLGVVATSAVIEVIRTTSPVLVSTRLGLPSSDTGLIVAASSVGMMIGIAASVPLGRRGFARTMAPVGLVFQLVGLLLVSQATQLSVAAPAVGLIGCGFSFCFPVLTSTLQTEVPDAMRGRLMSIHQMAHLGSRPFAALAAGAITASAGVPAACLAGMILAPIGLIAVRAAWRGLDRRVDPIPVAAETVA
ncbi:MAG: MFS transporter [Chloroflexota bacterium]|nr:MFS transporter [Chloroflexota bacterium]